MARCILSLLLTHTGFKFQEYLRGQRHPLQNSFSFHMGLYQQAAASKTLFCQTVRLSVPASPLEHYYMDSASLPNKPSGGEPQSTALSLAVQHPGETERWPEAPGEDSSAPVCALQTRNTEASCRGKNVSLLEPRSASLASLEGQPGTPERSARSSWWLCCRASGRAAGPATVPAGLQKSLQPVCSKVDTTLHLSFTHSTLLLFRSVHWLGQIEKNLN